MVIAIAPILIAVIGALVYALADGKPAELGRIAFACGLLVLVWTLATRMVHVG